MCIRDRLYVVAIDVAENALVVGPARALGRDRCTIEELHLVSGEAIGQPFEASAQIRYRAAPAPAVVTPAADGSVVVRFAAALRDITPGQAAVFYTGEICLGGGVIIEAGE
ncbi:MAG: tRNA 2-thiouridine(34) synthase MnmA, partial [Anaerolineae bacterium]|nr:tRNA 2-thiouridine(34) synthase MnmA [Anaerolineae bacterium]